MYVHSNLYTSSNADTFIDTGLVFLSCVSDCCILFIYAIGMLVSDAMFTYMVYLLKEYPNKTG